MKKLFFVALISFGFLFLFSSHASAASCGIKSGTCDESCIGGNVAANGDVVGGTTEGLVPCGREFGRLYRCGVAGGGGGGNAFGTIRADSQDNAVALCRVKFPPGPGQNATATLVAGADNANPVFGCRCELYHTFILGRNIYIFIIWDLAAPLAGLLLVLGGVLLLLSGASTKLHDLAKHMLWGAVWGIAIIFLAYLIVSVVLMALGVQGAWNVFNG